MKTPASPSLVLLALLGYFVASIHAFWMADVARRLPSLTFNKQSRDVC